MTTDRDNKGRFTEGNPGKPKGSSKNKFRDRIRDFIDSNWNELPKWFSKLKEKEKIDVILALTPYAVSKLQSISMTDSEGEDLKAEKTVIDYNKLSPNALREVLANTKTIKENE
ncbi:MAG: hypothetical protein AB7O48_10150 [Cyclobacteriaceae bacterium]